MEALKKGEFYGLTSATTALKGLTLTDTEYTHDFVDWHYHENAYFTFILAGNVIEGNKDEIYTCSAGSLLFHNWDDAHYNVKPKGYTRGFHLEIEPEWFNTYQIDTDSIRGSISLNDPCSKLLMYKLFKETKLENANSSIAIDSLIVELFERFRKNVATIQRSTPAWVAKIKELLQDCPEVTWSLINLADYLGVHPSHLSRDFPKHFNCRLGEYVRSIKLQKALGKLSEGRLSLTTIALESGFSDQSHFIRTFKELYGITPLTYRKLLVR